MLVGRDRVQSGDTYFRGNPHPCPNCGRTMQLTRSTAHTGGISGLRSYGCAECGIWSAEDGDEEVGVERIRKPAALGRP